MATNMSRSNTVEQVMIAITTMLVDGLPWCLLHQCFIVAGLDPQRRGELSGSFVECAVYPKDEGMPIVVRWEQDAEAPTVVL